MRLHERVVASRARDVIEDHSRTFKFDDIPVPFPESYKGTSASRGLRETVRQVSDWMREHV